MPPDSTLRYAAAPVALGPGGARALVVFVVGRSWCGSGGCTTLVLVPTDSSYRVVGEISINHPPIAVLPTRHHGWRDLAVIVQGGSIRTPRRSIVRFDGHCYENSPSITPVTHSRGRVLIRSYEQAVPLYQ